MYSTCRNIKWILPRTNVPPGGGGVTFTTSSVTTENPATTNECFSSEKNTSQWSAVLKKPSYYRECSLQRAHPVGITLLRFSRPPLQRTVRILLECIQLLSNDLRFKLTDTSSGPCYLFVMIVRYGRNLSPRHFRTSATCTNLVSAKILSNQLHFQAISPFRGEIKLFHLFFVIVDYHSYL